MGVPVSLILIAVGAILAFAVHTSSSGAVDVNTVGWIVLAVGLFGLLLTLVFWGSWAGPGYWTHRRAGYGPPDGRYGRAPSAPRRRTTVVEDDDPPPPPY